MKVVEFKGNNAEEALKVIEDLRAAVVSGEVVAFIVGGIKKDDGTVMWLSNVGRAKTNLQMMGAATNLLLHFWQGDIK